MNVKDYMLLQSEQADGLTHKVQEAIEKGFQPLGGVAYNSRHGTYVQAMVKYDKQSGIWS